MKQHKDGLTRCRWLLVPINNSCHQYLGSYLVKCKNLQKRRALLALMFLWVLVLKLLLFLKTDLLIRVREGVLVVNLWISLRGEGESKGSLHLRGAHFDFQAKDLSPTIRQVPRPNMPTGGRISFFLQAWEKDTFNNSKWVSYPVKCPYSTFFGSYQMVPQDLEKSTDSQRWGKCFVEEHAIEEVKGSHPRRGFFSRLFLVQKQLGELETHHRSFSSEQVCHMSSFQNGDIRLYQAISQERHLGDFPRSSGCILPHYDSQEVSSVSPIH